MKLVLKRLTQRIYGSISVKNKTLSRQHAI